jgi:hypothetical protein
MEERFGKTGKFGFADVSHRRGVGARKSIIRRIRSPHPVLCATLSPVVSLYGERQAFALRKGRSAPTSGNGARHRHRPSSDWGKERPAHTGQDGSPDRNAGANVTRPSAGCSRTRRSGGSNALSERGSPEPSRRSSQAKRRRRAWSPTLRRQQGRAPSDGQLPATNSGLTMISA